VFDSVSYRDTDIVALIDSMFRYFFLVLVTLVVYRPCLAWIRTHQFHDFHVCLCRPCGGWVFDQKPNWGVICAPCKGGRKVGLGTMEIWSSMWHDMVWHGGMMWYG
jgi:hypothetical protein